MPNRYDFRDSVSGVKRGGHHGGGGGGNSGDVADVTIERNSDRKGADYRNLSTANAKDCAFLCSEERRCVAFAYQVREKRCWLKDRVPNRYNLNNSVSGVKREHHSGGGGQVHLPGQVGSVTIERHTDRRGSDYRNLGTAKAENCAWLCSEDHRCRAFSYQTARKHWWLKDRVPSRYDLQGSVSGVKRGGGHHYDNDDYDRDERRRRNIEEMSNTYGAD